LYSKKDIYNSLKKLNLSKGDQIYCSVSFSFLGLPKFNITNSIDLCKSFTEIILDIIGENGSIFTPSFSYSFNSLKNNKSFFDINKTPSSVGPYGEYLRKLKESKRSIDPMISITGLGKNKNILLEQNFTSYGRGCMFDKLKNLEKLKILNIGIGSNYIPFLHHLDHISKCEHRYNKYFKGIIKNINKKNNVSWHYPVAYKKKEANPNGYRLSSSATKIGIIKSKNIGGGKIYISDYNKLFKFCEKLTIKNSWITAEGPPFK
tara:strand:+ start:443 stop:1228 length:786 start_codon:yes stop_codon:yes gene_type:complete